MQAFLLAANSAVTDDRARLQVIVRPPPVNQRVALVDAALFGAVGWVTIASTALPRFSIGTADGTRLVDANVEAGQDIRLAVPAGVALIVQAPDGDARFTVGPSETVALADLGRSTSTVAARGIGDALREGLFATPFGPTYYRGVVDTAALVGIPDAGVRRASAPPGRSVTALVIGVGSAVLAATALTFGGLALDARHDFYTTQIERDAADARDRYASFGAAALSLGVGAVVGAGISLWLTTEN